MFGLICIFGTHEVSPSIYSLILSTAYEESKEFSSPPSLLLLGADTKESLLQYTQDSTSYAPIDPSFKSPFIGWAVHDIARFLIDNSKGTSLARSPFLVADRQTSEDGNTLLIVDIDRTDTDGEHYKLYSCRINAESANTNAVTVSVGSGCVSEIADLADSDGVYRIDMAPVRAKREEQEKRGVKVPKNKLGNW